MGEEFTPAEGSPSGLAYVVRYDEDLWLSFTEERQKFCQETWVRKAEGMPGIAVVALQLLPDELFPMHGHERPYIVWQHRFENGPKAHLGIHSPTCCPTCKRPY